jgi:hypothetical protein
MYKPPSQLLSLHRFMYHPLLPVIPQKPSTHLRRRLRSSLSHRSSIRLRNALDIALLSVLSQKLVSKSFLSPNHSPSDQQNRHSRSIWRISTPCLLFALLPIACHPLSSVGRLVRRLRGICCSCWMKVVSKAPDDGRSSIERRVLLKGRDVRET